MFRKNLFMFDADTGSNGGETSKDNVTDSTDTSSGNEGSETGINLDSLTDEQLASLSEKYGLVTNAQLEEIIENKHKRWEKDNQKKQERSKLSIKEQTELELQEIKKENERLKLERKMDSIRDGVKVDLSKNDVPYTEDVVAMIVSESEEESEKRLNALKTYVSSIKKSIEEDVRKELRGSGYQSFASGSNKSGAITKQDILNIKDDIKRQQAMAENIHLFN